MSPKCKWIKFCDDTDARKPLIVEKSLINPAACPGIGTNLDDPDQITIGKVERSRKDKCEDCPYCSSGVSFSKPI